MKQLFLSLKWLMVVILSIFIILDIYLRVQGGHINIGGFMLKIILLWVLLHQCRISWVTGVTICIYGLYSILIVSNYAAEPNRLASEFTSSIDIIATIYLKRNVLLLTLSIVPLTFYFVTLITFLTKPVLRYYHLIK